MTPAERESRQFMRGLVYGLTFSAPIWGIVLVFAVWILS